MTIKKPTREEWMRWLLETPVIPENIPEYHTGDAIRLFDPKTDRTEFKPPLLARVTMEDYWGERCPDFDPECSACRAWEHFDRTNEVME